MHLYFIGIGGTGLSALAHLALDCGFEVSGSDRESNFSTLALEKRGVKIFYQQNGEDLEKLHQKTPIYWLIHSSSIKIDHPEMIFASENQIKISKRHDLVNFILRKKELKMLAVAGTHGKTTTTSMLIWLFKNLGLPISFVVGTNLSFANSGQYEENSEYFVYECDEFDRQFLNFTPLAGVLTSIDYDHPDTYPTEQDYLDAFHEFALKTKLLVAFSEDLKKIDLQKYESDSQSHKNSPKLAILKRFFANKDVDYQVFHLPGKHNRQNAALARKLVLELFGEHYTAEKLEQILSSFPGTSRRMEKLAENLYSDYAHHPTEIKATLQLAQEISKNVVIVYQPHQNIRQHLIQKQYQDCFSLAKKVYWLPTYLSREDPDLSILSPQELMQNLSDSTKNKVEVSDFGEDLQTKIRQHQENCDLVLVMGAGTIDDWARENLS